MLNFDRVFMMIFYAMNKSLQVSIYEFFDVIMQSDDYVSKQAFSQARMKINPAGFIELQDDMVQEFYRLEHEAKQLNTHFGRLIIAVDGSYVQLPPVSELRETFGASRCNNGNDIVNGLMMVAYDVSNGTIVGADLCSSKVGERELFQQLYPRYKTRLSVSPPICWVFDRGYPSFEYFHFLISEKQEFLMRCAKDNFSELKTFRESAQVDEECVIDLNRPSRKSSQKALREKLGETELKIRLIKVIEKDKTIQYLITNSNLSLEELAEIYRMRWCVEEANDYLKNTVQIERISSKKVIGVYQDFNSQILGAMFHKVLVYEANQKLVAEGYKNYKVNLSTSKEITNRRVARMLMSDDDITDELKKLTDEISRNKIKIVLKPPQPRMIKRKAQKYHLNNRPCI